MPSSVAQDTAVQFAQRYGREPEWLIVAPGRVNLIGEHTDYNSGFVLPMAIERQTVIAAGRAAIGGGAQVRAYSQNLDEQDEFVADTTQLKPTGSWSDYIKGVAAEFIERGLAIPSLDVVVNSDIPMGCGLSSSAALQVATAHLLRQIDSSIVAHEAIPELCQVAEHKFAGVPVGIMDQFCIANATSGHAVFLDCRSLQAEQVSMDDPNVAVLIVDSRVSRKLRSGAYAERREQCEAACRVLGVGSLRDVGETIVEDSRDKLGDLLYRRAKHIVSENNRTVEAVSALRSRDWHRVGELMAASHRSMQNDFEISSENLDCLVSLLWEIGTEQGVHGARMTGGGFGGCIVALVDRRQADKIVARLSSQYHDRTGLKLAAYVTAASAGVQSIPLQTAEKTNVG